MGFHFDCVSTAPDGDKGRVTLEPPSRHSNERPRDLPLPGSAVHAAAASAAPGQNVLFPGGVAREARTSAGKTQPNNAACLNRKATDSSCHGEPRAPPRLPKSQTGDLQRSLREFTKQIRLSFFYFTPLKLDSNP